jgi:hypothetical protein
MQKTVINRPWLLKMALFGVGLVLFGLYGLYDATIAYPNRGEAFASYAQFQYLDQARSRGPLGREVSVADPRAELTRLNASNPEGLEMLRQRWLASLAKIGRLTPERTTMTDPEGAYAALSRIWVEGAGSGSKPKPQPKELASFDLPLQWVIVLIGFGGAGYLLVLFISARAKRYGWEQATRTLTLPRGETLTPADLEEVDKRKWDKFLVFLKIKPGHPTLAGQELKLDLLRYKPLEEWILEMERAAFPERATEAPAPPAPAQPEPAGA